MKRMAFLAAFALVLGGLTLARAADNPVGSGRNARVAVAENWTPVHANENHCGSRGAVPEIPVIVVRHGAPDPSLPRDIGDVQEDQICKGIPGSNGERECQQLLDHYCWPWIHSDGKRDCY